MLRTFREKCRRLFVRTPATAPELAQPRASSEHPPRTLAVGSPPSASGAIFKLDKPSTVLQVESLSTGAVAELLPGSPHIVVRRPSGPSAFPDAFTLGIAEAQETLDFLSMRGGPALVLEDVDALSVVWWTEARGRVLRLTTVTDINASISATATVRDAKGNIVVPPPPPASSWHPSMRYFRLSQYTPDLFDAYRNMYLALEAALSSVVPQLQNAAGTVTEREGDWLKRALQHVDTILPLSRYAPPGSTAPVDDVFDDLYRGTRTGLFHAKSGRPVLLPHGATDRNNVSDSLERLSRLYLDVVGHFFGLRRPGGGMTYQGFELMVNHDGDLALADDAAEATKDDTIINPSGGPVLQLPTRRAPELDQPGLLFWLGEIDIRGNPTVAHIRRVGLLHDGTLAAIDRLDEPLAVEDVDILEVQFGYRLVNTQLPRSRFST